MKVRFLPVVAILVGAACASLLSQTNVANNAANLKGKTLLAAENSDTVTGALTYDRDPSAPFIVTSGSAKVTNLDADLLDGISSAAFTLTAGTNTFTGSNSFTGAALTIGDAAADTLTVTSTITSDLKFTDNTYDIGKSAATRPRDLFLSRNAVISGTALVTGVATHTAQSVFTGGLQTGAIGNYINDTSNIFSVIGLTLNQGTNDDEIMAFKSSEVAHGMTSIAETDTYGTIRKHNVPTTEDGGIRISGFTEAYTGIEMRAVATTADTNKNVTAVGNYVISSAFKSGTSATTMPANSNMFIVQDGFAIPRFILDSDGDSHQDVGTAWTNFDAFDDSALLDSLSYHVSKPTDPIKARFASALGSMASKDILTRHEVVTFNDDGHHFVNMSRLTMLLTGAVRQQADELASLKKENLALARRLATLESPVQRARR